MPCYYDPKFFNTISQYIPADTSYSNLASPPVTQSPLFYPFYLNSNPSSRKHFLPPLPTSKPLCSFEAQIKIHLLRKVYQDCSERQLSFKVSALPGLGLNFHKLTPQPPSVCPFTSPSALFACICNNTIMNSLFHMITLFCSLYAPKCSSTLVLSVVAGNL